MSSFSSSTFLFDSLPNSLEPSPYWEGICSATQEISSTLWNLKAHHRTHKHRPLVFIISQMNPVHTPSYLFKIHFNIILSFTSVSSYLSLSFKFSYQNPFMYFNSFLSFPRSIFYFLFSTPSSVYSKTCPVKWIPVSCLLREVSSLSPGIKRSGPSWADRGNPPRSEQSTI
jgi:hypothetical protein